MHTLAEIRSKKMGKMKRYFRKIHIRKELQLLLLVAILTRIIFLLIYHPVLWPDSGGYLNLAQAMTNFNIANDLGARTPVYPFFIALLKLNSWSIFLAQSLLGIATSIFLYSIFTRLSGKPAVGVISGLVHSLNPSTLFFEASILSETLTTFLVCLTVLFAFRVVDSGKLRPSACFLVGITSSLAGLTKPLFQLLPIALMLVVTYAQYSRYRRLHIKNVLLSASSILLPFLILIIGWSYVNYSRFGYFTLSTLTGYHLTEHSGKFIEKAPEEYKIIADIYIQERDKKVAITGTSAGTIERAQEKMLVSSGLSHAELSKKLTKMSITLFITNPVSYGKSVIQSFILFWFPAPYHQGYSVGKFFSGREVWWVYPYSFVYLLLIAAYFSFILLLVINRRIRNLLWKSDMAVIFPIIAYTSVVSSMTEFGENARHKVPIESLVMGLVVLFVYLMVSYRRSLRTSAKAG